MPNPPFHPPPATVPPCLYRVDYPGSRTLFTPTGFIAANTTTTITTSSALHYHASAHFSWASRSPSPFISLFADLHHATRWALACSERRGGAACYVVEISTTALSPGPIFRAADLLVAGVRVGQDWGMHWNEYLVLWQIPLAACVREVVVRAGGQEYVNEGYGRSAEEPTVQQRM